MRLHWANKALSDVVRLHQFLAMVNPYAATRSVQTLVSAPVQLLEQARMGERLEEFAHREVRRLLVGQYEIRYEIKRNAVIILRVFHTREQR